MKSKDLYVFIAVVICSIIIGFLYSNLVFFCNYDSIVTFLSIIIGFEITSLSILFNSPLKKSLYDRTNSVYITELHRLRSFYGFSIYIALISVLIVIFTPQFTITLIDKWSIQRSIIVCPVIFPSVYCFIKLCKELLHIFIYPTNN